MGTLLPLALSQRTPDTAQPGEQSRQAALGGRRSRDSALAWIRKVEAWGSPGPAPLSLPPSRQGPQDGIPQCRCREEDPGSMPLLYPRKHHHLAGCQERSPAPPTSLPENLLLAGLLGKAKAPGLWDELGNLCPVGQAGRQAGGWRRYMENLMAPRLPRQGTGFQCHYHRGGGSLRKHLTLPDKKPIKSTAVYGGANATVPGGTCTFPRSLGGEGRDGMPVTPPVINWVSPFFFF